MNANECYRKATSNLKQNILFLARKHLKALGMWSHFCLPLSSNLKFSNYFLPIITAPWLQQKNGFYSTNCCQEWSLSYIVGTFPIQILNSGHLCQCNKQQLGPTETITDPGLLGCSTGLYDWHTEQTMSNLTLACSINRRPNILKVLNFRTLLKNKHKALYK